MKSSPHLQEDPDPGFQIAPMVDVVFVLMLFFMACAGFRAKERELRTGIGGKPGSSVAVIDVTVASDGSVLVNNQPMGTADDRRLPALTKWLRNVRETFGESDTLVIRPAPTVTHERVMQVLNAAAASGWQKLTFG